MKSNGMKSRVNQWSTSAIKHNLDTIQGELIKKGMSIDRENLVLLLIKRFELLAIIKE